ncbi:hypothetical protein PF008_g24635 [Phytophthora fragariae]|uniref:Uncharacterized protein n=1 Tax=Phytophthora fragariae TaxID=53985 RepID=A0A6G0QN49_9STRA|nr:hypothetical protein PF008_g24635 [Phytophthora fragariae]
MRSKLSVPTSPARTTRRMLLLLVARSLQAAMQPRAWHASVVHVPVTCTFTIAAEGRNGPASLRHHCPLHEVKGVVCYSVARLQLFNAARRMLRLRKPTSPHNMDSQHTQEHTVQYT